MPRCYPTETNLDVFVLQPALLWGLWHGSASFSPFPDETHWFLGSSTPPRGGSCSIHHRRIVGGLWGLHRDVCVSQALLGGHVFWTGDWGISLKVLLVVAQLVGYTLSKFLGIKVVSEAGAGRRIALIAGLIGLAFLPLALLPQVPPWAQVGCLFINGLPLGMIWGLIFGFLEGRRVTEFLGLGMSVSFIFASGWTKSVGVYLMTRWAVPELWMPAIAGLVFLPLLMICLVLLAALPAPSSQDVAERSERAPMDGPQRRQFLARNAVSLALLILPYVLLTVYRDLRDTFMADVLKELGVRPDPSFFARVESMVGLGVLAALAGLWWIRDHWRALGTYHVLISLGAILVGGATLAFQRGWLGPTAWMVLTGLGGYLGYVPFNSVLFDRLLAATRQAGTAAFLIQVADSVGYLASASLYLQRTFTKASPA